MSTDPRNLDDAARAGHQIYGLLHRSHTPETGPDFMADLMHAATGGQPTTTGLGDVFTALAFTGALIARDYPDPGPVDVHATLEARADAAERTTGESLHPMGLSLGLGFTRLATATAPRDPEKGTATEALEFLADSLTSTVDTDDEAAVADLLATVVGVYQLRITQGRGIAIA